MCRVQKGRCRVLVVLSADDFCRIWERAKERGTGSVRVRYKYVCVCVCPEATAGRAHGRSRAHVGGLWRLTRSHYTSRSVVHVTSPHQFNQDAASSQRVP